ncbi:MAG: hypothetical protein LW636_00725 [Planctomycetaceae bacterium]|jgi:hypothetical protein|nr:hypothetical protein [Planctomycetaceae bacterium]
MQDDSVVTAAGARERSMETIAGASSRSRTMDVAAATVVFRLVREELCVGLPVAAGRRSVPACTPDAAGGDAALHAAAQASAARAVAAREIVRIAHAGVRACAAQPGTGSESSLIVVSWATARPVVAGGSSSDGIVADEVFIPLSALPELDADTRSVLSCAFEAFLDATLADAVTRRLLPRHVLFRKTDGFDARSPFEQALGRNAAASTPQDIEPPIFVGLLPDPFPLSALRELYERLLGAPLDRGNFRRQFHEIISLGPVKALPIFERGVPHRAGQLFTFDRLAWTRFATK